MSYEVEQKFRFPDAEAFHRFCAWAQETLIAPTVNSQPDYQGGRIDPPIEETDLYFNHPARDFRCTDEAFRIRFRSSELDSPVCERLTENYITYKGPKLDLQTKTRREIELPLPTNASVERWSEMFIALGFVPAGQVNKRRQKIHFLANNTPVELSLDILLISNQPKDWLYFAEVELIAQGEADLDRCRKQLVQIIESLNLTDIVRKSYLEIVLNT